MSKPRAEMRDALKSLDAATPLRIPSRIAFKAPEHLDAPVSLSSARSRNGEETGSEVDRVQNSPGPNLTGSKFEPIKMKTEKVESKSERLHADISKFDPVNFEQLGAGFTPIPHSVLRAAGFFEEPIDFMVYLHLFTFSWGFQRETVDMGLTQLERFTGAARNTIRRSLERLINRKWITEIQQEEPGRISRKWKIRNPCPKRDLSPGSKPDPVKNGSGQVLTPRGLGVDPVRGSNSDPYIESSKQRFKETLSIDSPELRAYFDAVKTPRKRESELRAFRELRERYSEGETLSALKHVQTHGVGGRKETCHSPMAFLAKAIESVMTSLRQTASEAESVQAIVAASLRAQEELRGQRDREEAAIAEKIAEFESAFPDLVERSRQRELFAHDSCLSGNRARLVIAAQRWSQVATSMDSKS
jgi:hypothetical protein